MTALIYLPGCNEIPCSRRVARKANSEHTVIINTVTRAKQQNGTRLCESGDGTGNQSGDGTGNQSVESRQMRFPAHRA